MVKDPSTRGRTLPIGRSDPGPIVRAGVVSLWAHGAALAGDSPLGSGRTDPGVPPISLAGEEPPRHRCAKRPLGWVEEGPLHPCLVTDVGVPILGPERGGHVTGRFLCWLGLQGALCSAQPRDFEGVGPVTSTPRRPYAIRSCGGDISTEVRKSRADTAMARGGDARREHRPSFTMVTSRSRSKVEPTGLDPHNSPTTTDDRERWAIRRARGFGLTAGSQVPGGDLIVWSDGISANR